MITAIKKLRYGKQYGYQVLFKNQEKRAFGKTGVIIAEMGLPEEYEFDFYSTFTKHVLKYSTPFLIAKMILADKGIGLLDPDNPLAREEFVPKQLIDAHGSFTNKNGLPYTQCKVKWIPPIKKNPWDHGYFLYKEDGPSGHPDICDKVGAKVVGWYYGKLIPQQRVPWRSQLRQVYDEVVAELSAKNTGIEFRNAYYMNHNSLKTAVEELITAGCETIVYQSINCPLYTDLEDYSYVLPKLHKLVKGRARLIMSDQMGNQPTYRKAYSAILQDHIKNIPAGKSILIILSRHGHPFKKDTMDERAHLYRKPLEKDLRAIMADWDGKWDMIWSFDEYADLYWDKKQSKVETYSAYSKAISEGYDYALELPTEFPAENTDLMIFHAMKKFEAFSEFNKFAPIHYPDWESPFVRKFNEGKTTGIYCGTPVGPYRKYIVQAVVDSISEVL